jgi:hypothetical protein
LRIYLNFFHAVTGYRAFDEGMLAQYLR